MAITRSVFVTRSRKARNAILALFLLCICWPAENAHAARLDVPPPPKTSFSLDALRGMAESIAKTGVGQDAIAALYRPKFLSVSDASLSMEHDEPVFIVTYPTGLVRIYPQRILVWHEVINDVLPDPTGATVRPDTPLSALDAFVITYSPLTGTLAAYYATAGRYSSTFGVTGQLLNANTLLYDRLSRSTWSQLLGTCIDGPMVGKRLSPIQVVWASWQGAKNRYPNAQVLSRSTGYKRNYGRDPYGSYMMPGNYYDDLRLLHPLRRLDNRLAPKKRILGLEIEGIFGAVQLDAVKEAGVLNLTLGTTPLAAIYDSMLNTVRIFDRRLPDPSRAGSQEAPLTLSIFEGKLIDNETHSEWNSEGVSTYGRLREKTLKPVLSTHAMWFAWSAFYPETIVLPEKSFIRPNP